MWTPVPRVARAIAMGLTLAVVAIACGDGDGDSGGAVADAELLPFELVQASPFAFEVDPNAPDGGIFRVTTTEPMICAIVWGESTEFGNFNNSLSMNGTGIVQHDVFLPGAEPGREYVFRVQGTTADGSQYRSAVGTFTLPDDASSDNTAGGSNGTAQGSNGTAQGSNGIVGPGVNVAADGTVVEVSSQFSATWTGANAIDGDPATEWATSGDGDEGFIVIDLGAPRDIGAVAFVTRSMADGTAVTEEFTVTVNGETFGPFPAGNLRDPRQATISTTGQVVRIDVAASTGGNVGAIEIGIMEAGT